jgi:integrase
VQKVLLTAKFIDAIKPPAVGRLDYRDTVSKGLTLRVSPTVWTWSVRASTPNGKRVRVTLGALDDLTLKDARLKADDARNKVAKGGNPTADKRAARAAAKVARAAARGDTDTVEALSKEYIRKHAKVHKRSWRDDQRMLDAEILPHWKTRKVRDLTRREVRERVGAIARRGSPITANRCLSLIRKMLNFGIQEDWIEANVASLIAKPGAERSRERVLTHDEIRWVWAACETERPHMRDLLRLRLVTAQRGGELARLKWSDREGDWLTIPESVSKNKRAHRVPLTPQAVAILDAIPHIDKCDWIFPGRSAEHEKPLGDEKMGGRRVGKAVLAALRQLDPDVKAFDFRGHDLRRTAATEMAEAGVSPADISKVLNHAEGGPRATQVYNRYQYDREKRLALEAWDRRLAAILAEKAASSVLPFTRRAS